ncbi:LCP family protein, partial [Streptomyces clavuligerus]
ARPADPGHPREQGTDREPGAPVPAPRGRRGGTRQRPPSRRRRTDGRTAGRTDGRPGTARDGGTRRAGQKRQGKNGGKGRRRALRWTATVLSLLILATGAAGYLYYEHLNSRIKKDRLTLGRTMPGHKANAAGQTPLNILVIGSDARNSKENQQLGGAKETFNSAPLADVQMLIHLSADRSNISVVSMPRDTMLRIPECADPKTGKVHPASDWVQTNESLGRGGAGCTVATWYELTGITIDHFMMIDFAGVVSMADAIGGVPVCVKQNIHSRTPTGEGSGLRLAAGTTPIQGEDALKWLRTRYGFGDGTDLARTRAQHMYMNSMVRQLRKNTKLSDPVKLRKLAEAAIDALTVDEGIESVKKLLDIGNELKDVAPERITMSRIPVDYSKRPGFTGKVEPIPGEAENVFRMIREDIALDGKDAKDGKNGKGTKGGKDSAGGKGSEDGKKPGAAAQDPAAAPAEIGVLVRNGTGGDGALPQRGRASEVSALLQGKGFTQAVADTAVDPRKATLIRFSNVELEGDAQAVAKALGIPLTSVRKSTDVTGIELTVGADWRLGSAFPEPQVSNKTPESANALRGDQGGCMDVQPGFTW